MIHGGVPFVFSPLGVYFSPVVFQGQEPVLIQAFLTKTSVESLYEGIVGGLPGSTEIQLPPIR
jgi:hypothetical protein